jgi:hypothetical protein
VSIYVDAVEAFQASQGDREGEARTVLSDTLSPEDVSGLTVADVQAEQDFTTYVLTDGYVNLAVVLRESGSEVALVTGSIGDWTRQGVVASLADLGRLLPSVLPPPDSGSSKVPAWKPNKSYMVGDKVTYGGKTYECLQPIPNNNPTWTPSAVPALWKAV